MQIVEVQFYDHMSSETKMSLAEIESWHPTTITYTGYLVYETELALYMSPACYHRGNCMCLPDDDVYAEPWLILKSTITKRKVIRK